MDRPQRWIALFSLCACVAGAVLALSAAAPFVSKPSAAAIPTQRPVATQSLEEQRATRAVVGAANSLTKSIARARSETSHVLARSFASLAQAQAGVAAERNQIESARSQLAAEQLQITSEAQQLTARAASLSAEGVALQREAQSLKAAQALAAQSTSAPSGESSSGGGQNDN